MKNLFSSIVLVLLIATSAQTSAQTSAYYRVTGGANVTVPNTFIPQTIYVYSTGAVAVNTDYNLTFASMPATGTHFRVVYDVTSATLGMSRTFNFFGTLINGYDAALVGYVEYNVVVDHTGTQQMISTRGPTHINNVPESPTISGTGIIDGTINYSTKLNAVPGGYILMGDLDDICRAQPMSGDVLIDNGGTTSIATGVIVNADVSGSAAIARTKIANGTASHVIINDGSGVLTSEATLNPSRGGLGANVSASTGFVTFSSGSSTIGSISCSTNLTVSFESGYQSDNKIKMPCAGTVTGIYAYATKAIAGTDNGTIVAKNSSGTTMTSGTITYSASDPVGTAYSVSPSANNTFSSGDILSFTTSKTTAGGVVLLTVTYTRNQ